MKRELPTLSIAPRAGVEFNIPPAAGERWKPTLQAREDDSTISVLSFIGPEEFGGVSSKRVASALRAIGKDRDVVVLLNSPGGALDEGLAIYNLLRAHPREVTVRIIGMAASAASLVAMAGDRIEIGNAAFMMVHNTQVIAAGDRHAMAEVAAFLQPVDDALADVYAARTGRDKEEVAAMMDKETWLVGDRAVEAGFADALLPADAIEEKPEEPAAATRRLYASLAMGRVPQAERMRLLNAIRPAESPAATPQPAAQPAAPNERERVKAILECPEATGREELAKYLAFETTQSVETVKGILATAPKRSRLDDLMAKWSPGISAQEVNGSSSPTLSSPDEIFAHRAAQMKKRTH